MDTKKLSKDKLGDFMAVLGKQKKLYTPQKEGDSLKFKPAVENQADLTFPRITTVPPKSVFFPQTETLYRFAQGDTAINLPDLDGEAVLLGVRPCDARAMTIVDSLFSWDIDDPYYLKRREQTALIGLACLEPGVNCFCTSVGGNPASTEGLDILLTDLGGAFLMQILTEKGEEIKALAQELLEEATEEDKSAAEKLSQDAASRINRKIDTDGIPEKLPELWESPLWKNFSESCLGCGICTFLCPTCHCFDIQDEVEGLEGRRCRVWDSCMFAEYTRHASGHNPRPTTRERMRNRINHKYSYFVKNFGKIACVGCGRCIDLCPVNVDIINILTQVGKEGKEAI